jgi:predicted NAD/FAD-dependent oxidoreductase
MLQIAILGAGLAGLACAQALQAAGAAVTVFEKSRGPGGRATTKRVTLADASLAFDQGPPCFTAQTPEFATQVQAWARQGVVAEWPAASAALEQTAWVGTPGMQALGKHLAQGVTVLAQQRVTQIQREFTLGAPHPRWRLVWRDEALADHRTELFDAVVVATPAEQAVSLLAPVSDAAPLAAHVRSEACWAVMLAFDQPTGLAADWWEPSADSGFALAVRDSAKPGQTLRPGTAGVAAERWVLHASAAWSQAHLLAAPDAVTAQALAALRAGNPALPGPSFSAAHRWRYSQPANPIRLTHVWQPQRRLGVCGDWLGNANWQGVERAWTSGTALASAMQAMLPKI